jgi:hypothetical protein
MSDHASTIRQAVQQAKTALGTLVLSAVFTSVSAATYSPGTATATSAETTYFVDVAITAYDQYERKNTDIRATDLKVIMFGGIVEPKSGDFLTLNNGKLTVINCEPVYAGEEAVMYTLQCRR